MPALNLVIRADGSKSVGMGHINRALLITEYMNQRFGCQTTLVTRDDPGTREFICNKSFSCEIQDIPADSQTVNEIKSVIKIIKKRKADFMIFDLLEDNLTPEYLETIKSTGVPVCVITDSSFYQPFDVDLILNGNPNQEAFDYSDLDGQYLIGPQYFIMDSEYARFHPPHDAMKADLLITLGGSDHNNLIFRLLKALSSMKKIDSVIIITSKAAGYFQDLKGFITSLDFDVQLYADVPTLISYWGQANLALTAGGNSLFERIASGMPGATICQLPRQNEIADKFEELGVNVNFGYGPEIEDCVMRSSCQEFIQDKIKHEDQRQLTRQVVDGRGLERFAETLRNYL
jgi:UDP-2,4-diacetamido-2,4,6-trideoxy-beta-L-altropyranose hydrolase